MVYALLQGLTEAHSAIVKQVLEMQTNLIKMSPENLGNKILENILSTMGIPESRRISIIVEANMQRLQLPVRFTFK